jgi:brefeldin A-resistance guanine nucleotide exchange factor 1
MAPMIVAPQRNSSLPLINGEKQIKPSHFEPSGISTSGLSGENPADPISDSFAKGAYGVGGKTETMSQQPMKGPPRRPPPNRKPPPPRGAMGNVVKNSQAAGSLLIQPNNVCKVIKGEIHNVLNVMRTDPRYVSPLRFMEELPSDEQHPLLLQLRDLHRNLSEWELQHHAKQPPGKLYLPAFCSAIQGRDISASVTGAALHAIHKFVLYGFITSEPAAYTNIANTLLLCTFEESSAPAPDAEARRRNNVVAPATNQDDEQVVLKLLSLSALVVRCASLDLAPDVIVGLLDTCLHVSHRAKRASALLKSAASDALGQIVLEVFSQPNLAKARVAILTKLASLLNPQKNSDAYVVNSLMLVNIALETLTDNLTGPEITILQNDLCKFLLSWSTTHDLVILSLTMRVIFNLFQTIRNHLKVPLEVFLTSVHLRILEHASSHEEREVALESLLEFCQEPALMRDLYVNYDCDVNCTNLFSSICTTLGNVAAPSDFLAKVAVEVEGTLEPSLNGDAPNSKIVQMAAQAAAEVPLNALNSLALEGLLTIIESIARRVKSAAKDPQLNRGNTFASGDSVDDDFSEQLTEEELQERKKEKASLAKVAIAFNKNPNGKEWVKAGKDLGVCDETAEGVSKALYKAPGLDKVKLGAYLAKGPADKYPFEHDVRVAFVEQFHFSKDHSFASSLRVYLHKFRMPGEAQCIDRFMEAFSKEFYRQQGDSSVFKSSDAVFVLAFSTIMLNTDLHNPQNKTRMTGEQFIRNNRSINDGDDLPEVLLKQVYSEIKESEIQVQREIGEFISHSDAQDAEHFRSAWGDLLAKNVAAAAFTPVDEARKTMHQVGLHEKDMFLVIAGPALKSISSAFIRSWDDGSILDALKGLELMTHISTYFDLDNILNDIVAFLLSQGREFILGCVSLEYAGIESGAPVAPAPEDDETMSIVDPDSPLPHAILRAKEVSPIDPRRTDISGAAAYRGLLGLNMGLKIVRALFPRIRGAWPQLAEVLSSLRDARALPPGLADLDDFADSEGNVLPLSPFAQDSQKRLDNYYKGSSGKDGDAKKGWFRLSFFGRKGPGEEAPEAEPMTEKDAESSPANLTANRKTLIQIAKKIDIEKIMVLGPNVRLPIVKQSIKGLLESVDRFQPDNPLYEQHAAFSLELAVRALFANRERAGELLPLFLAKFDSVAAKTSKSATVVAPFVLERVVVTILRTHIHLYASEKVRECFLRPDKSFLLFCNTDINFYFVDASKDPVCHEATPSFSER